MCNNFWKIEVKWSKYLKHKVIASVCNVETFIQFKKNGIESSNLVQSLVFGKCNSRYRFKVQRLNVAGTVNSQE